MCNAFNYYFLFWDKIAVVYAFYISFRFNAFKIEFRKLNSMQAAVYYHYMYYTLHYLNRNVKFEKLIALPLGDDQMIFGLFEIELLSFRGSLFRLYLVLDALVYWRKFNCFIDSSRCSKMVLITTER